MSRQVVAVAAACLLGLAAAPASGQIVFTSPGQLPPGMQAPPRDTAQKTGTARILGRIVAADTGQPLRKAMIRAFSAELRENRSTTTDADGKYELKELPAGRYQLSVTKGSFVSLSYGQTRPFEPGKPLDVRDGQTVEKVDFALPRGGVITGKIVDEYGEAIADAQVSAMRYQFVQGRRRLTPAGRNAMTNDIGEYRLFGLAPGQYFLSATLRSGGTQVMDIAIDLMSAGSGDRSGYAPTYYPGTPNTAEAQRVTINVGQVLNDMNMALVPTKLARVSGTAVDSQGKPLAGGMVMSMQRSGVSISSMTGGQVRPDGSFTISNLSPGDYIIQAILPGSATDLSDMASAQVTVAGEDVTGVQLVGQKSITITGRITASDPNALKSLTPGTLRPMSTPARPEDNLMAGIGAGKVNDDFTFELKARPGAALIRVPMVAAGWSLKAVRINGADVTDTGIDLRPNEDVAGVEVELTNTPTEVSGLVTNSRNEPVKDYTVIVFAREQDRWGFQSRFVQTGRPDQEGRFKIRGLPGGHYYAVAVEYMETGEAQDPEYLDRVKARAITFSLNDGETKVIDLKLSTSTL